MAILYLNTDTIQSELNAAAIELRAHFVQQEGTLYRVEDLEQALVGWLELSVEALVDDVLFHTLEGDCSCAFNRHAFELQLKRIQPVSPECKGNASTPRFSDAEADPLQESQVHNSPIAVV